MDTSGGFRLPSGRTPELPRAAQRFLEATVPPVQDHGGSCTGLAEFDIGLMRDSVYTCTCICLFKYTDVHTNMIDVVLCIQINKQICI